MINRLHAYLNNPAHGYDPVPIEHVKDYADWEWSNGVDESLIRNLEGWVGGFKGKRVLDLGGGPGHYSIAFAKLGAIVDWYDISKAYSDITLQMAKINNVNVTCTIGYIDEAPKYVGTNFDLIFNRICWYYCWNDKRFAKTIYSMLCNGGVCYIDTTHSDWEKNKLGIIGQLRTWLNSSFGVKIGHPYPEHNRIASLFLNLPIRNMAVDYTNSGNDRIIFKK